MTIIFSGGGTSYDKTIIVAHMLSLFHSIAIALILVGFLIIIMSFVGVGSHKGCLSIVSMYILEICGVKLVLGVPFH